MVAGRKNTCFGRRGETTAPGGEVCAVAVRIRGEEVAEIGVECCQTGSVSY